MTLQTIKESLLVLVLLLVIDITWLVSNGRMYRQLISNIQGSSLKINLGATLLAYATIFLTFIVFAIPGARHDMKDGMSAFMASMKNGLFLGLCIYAIYNFTNISIFKDYSWTTGVVDTVWGGILYATVTCITISSIKK